MKNDITLGVRHSLAHPSLKLTTFGEKNTSARKTKMENALRARVFEIDTSYLVEFQIRSGLGFGKFDPNLISSYFGLP